jgi:hypothetical protein
VREISGMKMKSIAIASVHAFIGWILCAATMGIGNSLTTMQNTLYIHATLAPIFFFLISTYYFKKYGQLSPLQIAFFFTSFVMFIDFFFVALIILKSHEMFGSILGTWIPFILIFSSTYLAGISINRKS